MHIMGWMGVGVGEEMPKSHNSTEWWCVGRAAFEGKVGDTPLEKTMSKTI